MVHAQTGVTDFQENMEALKHNFLLSGYFKKRGYEDSRDLSSKSDCGLPQGAPVKAFTFTAKQLFDSRDSAKLKNQKSLKAGGEFLAQNQFGYAVVVVSPGMEGDTQKDLVLTEARAMVIREYLVENFGFDDAQLKTLGMGKQTGARTWTQIGDRFRFSFFRKERRYRHQSRSRRLTQGCRVRTMRRRRRRLL